MRVGQTSFVVFLAKALGAFIAFVATIIFARILGAEVYGIYALVIAIVAWLKLFGSMGFGKAVKKRVSEGTQQDAYFTAGIVWLLAFGISLSIAIVLARPLLDAYVSGFDEHAAISIVWFLVFLLVVRLAFDYVSFTLEGEKLVHVSGLLEPLRVILKSFIQVGLVLLGFGLSGMLFGYALGVGIATALGLTYVGLRLRTPAREHFVSLFEYAKFSWLGSLKSHAYQDVDILILGAMVQTSLVGIYAIAWSITKVLRLFGLAISQAVFPEISSISVEDGLAAARGHIEDAIAYSGLIVIPGFVGGTILGERILALYGSEFVEGTAVLWLLLLGVIAYSYMRQFLNAMNALDRPDLSFWSNLVFISANVILNVVLIWWLGWVGAALASLISATIGMVLSFALLSRVLVISVPVGEIGRQVFAAAVMGVVVFGLDQLAREMEILQQNVVILGLLVGIGVAVYVGVLLAIAPRFRRIVDRNLPVSRRVFS